jgi:DNA replication protein DnaC
VSVGDPGVDGEWESMRAESAAQSWDRVIPRRFRRVRITDFSEAVAADIDGWARQVTDGVNLVVYGPVGVGKTGAACAAVRHAAATANAVGFRPAPELFDGLRPGGPEDLFRRVAETPILILDDLGAEKVTEWTGERTDMLVNRRYSDMLSTVVTTNLEPGALEAHVGERTFSRLVGEGAVILRLTGADRRRSA